MHLMAKKRKTNRNKYKVWGLRIPEAYKTEVRKVAEKNRRSPTEEVKIALEEYLAKQGLWPPPKPGKP